ncbi:MAG: hypothetical protein VW711_16820, partial [Verrucomicrobiales bacterium]
MLAKLPSQRSKEEQALLSKQFKANDKDYQSLTKEQERLRRSRPRVTTAMVLKEREEPRQTHLLIKGDFTRPDVPVGPGVPSVLHPLVKKGIPNRLDLARWIVSEKNPLTARVLM